MHGPTCVFWANLTPFSLKANAEASATKAMGDANAAAKTATGLAETDFLKNKAEAYKGFGEAYLVQTVRAHPGRLTTLGASHALCGRAGRLTAKNGGFRPGRP